MKPSALSLPGTISDLALTLPPGLSYEEVQDGLRFVGRTGRALGWWAADLLLYAESHFGESLFSQLAEELGYAPHTLQNLLTVGHAWVPKRRRAGLDLGHHAALARLDHEDQDHYADLAEAGETLPNGEKRRWTVSRLREELRALTPTREGTAPTIPISTPDVGKQAKPPMPVLARGQLIEFDDLPGRFRITQIYRVPGQVVVKADEV